MLLSILLATALGQAAQPPTEYRVLLVGLGPYAEQGTGLPSLAGATDVKTFRNALTAYYKIPDGVGSIHELNGTDATKEKIEAEFKDWLVKGAGPNRSMIFFYSGHGTMTIDRNQNLCSALVPINVKQLTPGGTFDPNTLISRDFFNDELKVLRSANATNITLIFDACDSGLVARGGTGTAISKCAINPGIAAPTSQDQNAVLTDVDYGDAAVIAAAKIGRQAWQNTPAGGNLTVALTRAMKDHAEASTGTSTLSYGELRDRTLANMAALSQSSPQEPVFVVSKPNKEVFGNGVCASQPAYRVDLDNSAVSSIFAPDPKAPQSFVMHAGLALGIQEKFTVGIWPIGANLEGPPKATAMVKTVNPTTSGLSFQNQGDLSWLAKSGGRARVLDGTPDALVNFDMSSATGPTLAALKAVFTPANDPLVQFDVNGPNCVHLVPPTGSPAFPNTSGSWRLCDGGGNGVNVGPLGANADPQSVATWADEAVRDFGRRQAFLALKSPNPWVKVEMDLVPVAALSGNVTKLKPNQTPQGSMDVAADSAIRVAIRVRATWSDGSTDRVLDADNLKPEDETIVSHRPHIALIDASPNGGVHLAFPDPGFTTSSDKQRLPVTGQWFYVGNRNDLLLESSLTTPDAISHVGGWNFEPKDGIGHDVIRLLATDEEVDYTPLLTTTRGPSDGKGAESPLGRLLTAYKNGRPVSRGQMNTAAVKKFAVVEVTLNVLPVGGQS